MAAQLDINIFAKQQIELKYLVSLILNNKFNIKEIYVIDDWNYTNQIKISSIEQVAPFLSDQKIILLYIYNNICGNAGIFIEQHAGMYLYNFWIDTKNLPQLDRDIIDEENQKYYSKFYTQIDELYDYFKGHIKIASIGVESLVEYYPTLEDIIKNSSNVNAWITDDNSFNILGYKKIVLANSNLIMFERLNLN